MIDLPVLYEDIKRKIVTFRIGNVDVPVISIPDLIQLKSRSGRKQDLSDVEHLRRFLKE